MSRRIAAIDFGTNTARLLIADLTDDGRFEQVALQRTIVRLGGGFSRETGLADDAIQRARLCLHQFADTIHRLAVDSVGLWQQRSRTPVIGRPLWIRWSRKPVSGLGD